jgi:hypothetical protein
MEALQELSGLKQKIDTLLYKTQGDQEYSEVDKNICYGETPDDKLYQNEFYSIIKKLEEVKESIEYLNLPIKDTGILNKNERGRYESSFMEYTSGYGIEVLLQEEESYKWVISRVEHNGSDYYIVGYSSVSMEGLQVRNRG